MNNAFTRRAEATKFVIIWGFYTNSSMLRREEFTCRKACWKRVQELFLLEGETYKGGPKKDLALLEVYVTVPGTHGYSVRFNRFVEGSKYAKYARSYGAHSPFISSGVYCG